MKTIYIWLTRLIALGVVAQAAFVAFGMFDILKTVEDGEAYTADTDYNVGQALHATFGTMVIPALALLLLIVAFFARVPGGVWRAALVVGLVALQVLLGYVAFPVPLLGVLHAANAFVLAGVAGFAGSRAGKAPPPDTAPVQEPATAT